MSSPRDAEYRAQLGAFLGAYVWSAERSLQEHRDPSVAQMLGRIREMVKEIEAGSEDESSAAINEALKLLDALAGYELEALGDELDALLAGPG